MNKGNKIFIVVAVVLAISNLIDFVFYGWQLRNLAGATGFALMACGTHKNLTFVSFSGAILVIATFVVKYFS